MKQSVTIIVIILLLSCTSKQVSISDTEPTVEPREVALVENSEISKTDSQQLVGTWQQFIKDLEAQKGKSSDTVECWTSESFQNGNYSAPDSLLVDTCIARLLVPLQKTEVWPLFKTDYYNVGLQKWESEQVGRFYISFPRNRGDDSKYHEMRHIFYFKKHNDIFKFQGYVYK